MTKAIDKAFEDAISDGVFPAAELLVASNGKVVHQAHYGDARKETCFDIASLTKPISTATLAMLLEAEGLLKLDDTIYQWLGGARRPEHKRITIRHLLNHTSGLPAWQAYYRELPISLIGTEAGKRMILDECYNEAPVAKPGEKTIYSDIGYMILGEVIEQAGGASLDALFSQYIARPLGLSDTFFIKLIGAPMSGRSASNSKGKTKRRRFASTEDCPWRERVIHGEVHDQNAYALGGIAGHAGLFSTAGDIHKFIETLIDCYHGRSNWLPTKVVQKYLRSDRKKPAGDEFVLGWNRPSRRSSSSGHHFGANSIGHLTYTGCSTWIDLDSNFWVIILTNRIHPSSTNERIKAFRPKIHDLIHRELIVR